MKFIVDTYVYLGCKDTALRDDLWRFLQQSTKERSECEDDPAAAEERTGGRELPFQRIALSSRRIFQQLPRRAYF